MRRAITVRQIGAIVVGHHFRCERLASGHLLVTGNELHDGRLLEPDLATVAPVRRAVAAVHVGQVGS